MCQVYVRCSSPSPKDLQANGMSNVRHLFVETFQSAIFSVVDAGGTKETLRQRGTKCGCSERYRDAWTFAIWLMKLVLVTT